MLYYVILHYTARTASCFGQRKGVGGRPPCLARAANKATGRAARDRSSQPAAVGGPERGQRVPGPPGWVFARVQGGGDGAAVRARTSEAGRLRDGSRSSCSRLRDGSLPWAPTAARTRTSEHPRRFGPLHRLAFSRSTAFSPLELKPAVAMKNN